jgi:hypothetical protein
MLSPLEGLTSAKHTAQDERQGRLYVPRKECAILGSPKPGRPRCSISVFRIADSKRAYHVSVASWRLTAR